jgi:hypothetical protein
MAQTGHDRKKSLTTPGLPATFRAVNGRSFNRLPVVGALLLWRRAAVGF